MRYAVDNIQSLYEHPIRISTEDLEKYAAEKASRIASGIAEALYDEAKNWALKKLQPGDLNLPGWRTLPELPRLPSLPNFNPPKF
ncbi:hypothetical protein K8374_09710 [Pseudomonas sp. p1(2021b)]|uniref:hypothetical protein n=1 Tax=Pseudomonas sp. p1(2021b) TaxID=2874628 RepID=UPI001CCC0C3A|nr:hypothetical protein [Pseudomonas sp. p1(2021b)]UBM27203.1 hypothetical protein K8374_09710 [Pseudomonas sp. p1(2021b)]